MPSLVPAAPKPSTHGKYLFKDRRRHPKTLPKSLQKPKEGTKKVEYTVGGELYKGVVDATVPELVDVSRRATSTEELQGELTWLSANNPDVGEMRDILEEVVGRRGVKPGVGEYEAVVTAEAGVDGSVERVEAALEEMEREGVVIAEGVWSAVLKVLAVHPDANLRDYVVGQMERHWMRMAPDVEDAIIAGMIRGRELELAMKKLEEFRKPSGWLNVLLVHKLCEVEDWEAVLQFTYKLQDRELDLPRTTWLHVLREASRHGYYQLTLRVWLQHVEPMYIVPDVDCCVKVLELANREASPKLAESAMVVLEDRYPEEAEKHKRLVELTYKSARQPPDPARYRRGNMFALLKRSEGHHETFFDPKIALAKRPIPSFLNPKRMERKSVVKSWSKRR